MRVMVCGSPDWTDRTAIRRQLEKLPSDSVIIHGDQGYGDDGSALWGKPDALAICGADKLAGQVAQALGMQVESYTPPEWQAGKRDTSAGPRRTARMLREGKPNLVLVFTGQAEESAAVADCIRQARVAGLEVRVIWE